MSWVQDQLRSFGADPRHHSPDLIVTSRFVGWSMKCICGSRPSLDSFLARYRLDASRLLVLTEVDHRQDAHWVASSSGMIADAFSHGVWRAGPCRPICSAHGSAADG